MAFDTPQATGGVAIHTDRACGVGPSFHTGQSLISAGEFSLGPSPAWALLLIRTGVNDCGRWALDLRADRSDVAQLVERRRQRRAIVRHVRQR